MARSAKNQLSMFALLNLPERVKRQRPAYQFQTPVNEQSDKKKAKKEGKGNVQQQS